MAAEHDPEQMAQLEQVAGQMFESMDRDDEDDDESGEESGEKDESGEEDEDDDESDEDSDGEADIGLMDDHEEQEVEMVHDEGDGEEEDAAVDHGHHHGYDDDDEMEASDEDAEDEDAEDDDEDEDHDEEEGAEINIEDDGDDDGDEEVGADDRWDVDDQDEHFDLFPPFDEHGTDAAPPPGGWGPGEIVPLHGHAHAAHAGRRRGGRDALWRRRRRRRRRRDAADDDDDGGAELAEQLQGLIGNIANQVGAQGGGPAPSRRVAGEGQPASRAGHATGRRRDFYGRATSGRSRPAPSNTRQQPRASNLAGGGILSDIFNLRNSLEEARRATTDGVAARRRKLHRREYRRRPAELIYDPHPRRRRDGPARASAPGTTPRRFRAEGPNANQLVAGGSGAGARALCRLRRREPPGCTRFLQRFERENSGRRDVSHRASVPCRASAAGRSRARSTIGAGEQQRRRSSCARSARISGSLLRVERSDGGRWRWRAHRRARAWDPRHRASVTRGGDKCFVIRAAAASYPGVHRAGRRGERPGGAPRGYSRAEPAAQPALHREARRGG